MMNRYLHLLEERYLPRLIVGAVIGTSAVSLLINLVDAPSIGAHLGDWLEAWLLDFSTDLATGGLVLWLGRQMIRQALKQSESAAPQLEALKTTYYIDAEEIPAPPSNIASRGSEAKPNSEPMPSPEEIRRRVLQETLADLRKASTPEARQLVINRVRLDYVDLWRGAQLVDVDMRGADLSGLDLSGVNFTKANLRGAQLHRANLRGAIFTMTQLIEADFQDADLTEARLASAFVSGVKMQGARLVRAQLQVTLWGADLRGADLSEANLSGAELFRANLEDANLLGANLQDIKISRDTILPDGNRMGRRSDLARFTNPAHPKFWRRG